ncbi:hypothetical protein V1T75_08760 [Tenacibaculum sp. FZY0031]|uniref:hypothetical protein n=1 Tax=Tenacibaculum sp. FZY0031 TaxID=3116648 RepID=UPI002EBC748E|nr:hypothetical protein [Tenacibaculum sp. FZY0031]
MQTHINKIHEEKKDAQINSNIKQKRNTEGFYFKDNRPNNIAQKKLFRTQKTPIQMVKKKSLRARVREKLKKEGYESLTAREKRFAPPSVIETGAGEGRFSKSFRKKFGKNYVATDIANEEGPNGFLSFSKKIGVQTKFGVNANEISEKFHKGTIDRIVGANPFGVKGVGGASYGLSKENPGGSGKQRYLPDNRFLKSAKPLLRPGGSVELYGRSNMLRDAAVANIPSTGKKGRRTKEEVQQVLKAKEKYEGSNANPYLTIAPDELHDLAKSTGYKVRVKRAKQPRNVLKGGNPDTIDGDEERAEKGLKPFNTRFSFIPEEDGYESDTDDPRIIYSDGEASDWEESSDEEI